MGNTVEITDVNVTLRDVMPKSVAIHDMAADDDRGMAYWYLGRGLLHIRVPNFGWRKRAIVRHDLHHLLTGYPCTPTGEMEMAAWEFAAGRFPHPGATAFCLPLVGMGAVVSPRRTFAAFVRGRRGTSLYATPLSDEVLASRIVDLPTMFPSPQSQRWEKVGTTITTRFQGRHGMVFIRAKWTRAIASSNSWNSSGSPGTCSFRHGCRHAQALHLFGPALNRSLR